MALDNGGLYSDILIRHNLSAENKRRPEGTTDELRARPLACGDDITLWLRVKNGVIEDAAYTGWGCAVSQASASILSELLRGKTEGEARKLAEGFLGMLEGRKPGRQLTEALGDALALAPAAELPERTACARLAWDALLERLGPSGHDMMGEDK